jgi:hypothetical protein
VRAAAAETGTPAGDGRNPRPSGRGVVNKDLTGRTRDEIVGVGSGNAPNGLTEKTVIAGQKAAALKLFEDKLKSA